LVAGAVKHRPGVYAFGPEPQTARRLYALHDAKQVLSRAEVTTRERGVKHILDCILQQPPQGCLRRVLRRRSCLLPCGRNVTDDGTTNDKPRVIPSSRLVACGGDRHRPRWSYANCTEKLSPRPMFTGFVEGILPQFFQMEN
jgi:hypothetical protein